MTPDLALTVTHALAAIGILHVACVRGWLPPERAFWGFAALGTACRPFSLYFPFWGKAAEAVGVLLFVVALVWRASNVKQTTKTPEDVAKASRLSRVMQDQAAEEKAEILAAMNAHDN